MITMKDADPVTLVDIVAEEPQAAKITINYTGGESFHVKNVRDITLGYDKGGKLVLVYSEDVEVANNTPYGIQMIDGVVTYAVTTGDIKSVVLDSNVGDDGIRRKLTLEVA